MKKSFRITRHRRSQMALEVVSKPPLGSNLCVGGRRSILKILNVFMRLNASRRLDLKPD
jgi:hypothetical protein